MGTASAKRLAGFECLAGLRHLANPSVAYFHNKRKLLKIKAQAEKSGSWAKEGINSSFLAFLFLSEHKHSTFKSVWWRVKQLQKFSGVKDRAYYKLIYVCLLCKKVNSVTFIAYLITI